MTKAKQLLLALLLFSAAGATQAVPVQEQIPDAGTVDWSNRVVQATGVAIAGSGALPGQIRAAKLDALRQMIETLHGLRLNSETRVENLALSKDVIRTRIEGVVKNYELVGDPVYREDGSIEVTVQMRLDGQGQFLDTVLPANTGSARLGLKSVPEVPGGVYTGLIVDARGLDVQPAISPRLLTTGGDVVFGNRYVDREWAIRYGMTGYASDVQEARRDERVAPNPLVIRAKAVSGETQTDLIIEDQDALLLQAVDKHLTFLQQCRVILVVD